MINHKQYMYATRFFLTIYLANRTLIVREMTQIEQTQAIIQVRRYVPTDFEAVKHLIRDLAHVYGDEFNEYLFTSQMQVQAMDASAGIFVASVEDEVKGCAFANTERDPRGVLHGRISNVIVEDGYQSKGVGSALVDESIK